MTRPIVLPAEEGDLRNPDLTWRHENRGNVAETSPIPLYTGVTPLLMYTGRTGWGYPAVFRNIGHACVHLYQVPLFMCLSASLSLSRTLMVLSIVRLPISVLIIMHTYLRMHIHTYIIWWLWLGDRETASKSRILGDCQSRESRAITVGFIGG